MSIKQNLKKLRDTLPGHVTLVAVSKTKTESDIMEAYECGHRIFGENKIQEMAQKRQNLPKDIQWHMIGHVQRNKVKYMAEYVSLIHGVDSLALLKEINKQAEKHHRSIDCLLQMHIAEEETKFGLNETELKKIITSDALLQMKNIRVTGLMGMATFTKNIDQIQKEFRLLKSLFHKAKEILPQMAILSMGMSGDYKLAIEEGSTMVRIGSSIFGKRDTP